jgi:hypothetical protein
MTVDVKDVGTIFVAGGDQHLDQSEGQQATAGRSGHGGAKTYPS